MKSRWESPSRVRIGFLDPTDFLTVYTGELMQGRLTVMGVTKAITDSAASLVLEFPVNGDETELKAKVAAVKPGPPPSAVLELLPLAEAVRQGIESYMTEVLRGETPPVRFRQSDVTAEDAAFDSGLTEEAAGDGDESAAENRRKTLAEQIKEMTVLEKIKLALVGHKDARTILFRDPQANMLMPYLLKNQRISMDEVTRIAGDATASFEAIRMISSNTNWMHDNTVKGKIIRNPKTNPDVAIRLLKALPLGEIRSIADSTSVKGALQKAARQILKDKGLMG